MPSVADALRREQREALARLTPAERLQMAFDLGDADLAVLAANQGLSPEDARRAARARRASGRRRAPCLEGLPS